MGLRLGEIDFRNKLVEPQLYLCKPNKTIISKLSEAFLVNYNPKLGALNELGFRLPIEIEKHHSIVENSNSKVIKGRYLIKMILGKEQQYFIINNVGKASSGEDFVEVKALGLGFELNDKLIRDLKVESINATESLKYVLKDTIWEIGYIDSEFDLKYRGLDIKSSTVLEVVVDIAKTFNALIVWDSINRKVNFHHPELVGDDKGFTIKYGKYLETLNHDSNTEEAITRLKLYGKEDLTIRAISPTGTPYIENFNYYIAPYQETRDYRKENTSISDIINGWTSNSTWIDNGVLALDSIDTKVNSIISPLTDIKKNYRITANVKATGTDTGKLGFLVRYTDDLNYYMVEWEHGFRNPVLNQLQQELNLKVNERAISFSLIQQLEDELFQLKTDKLTLDDAEVTLRDIIGKYEALILNEKSLGKNTAQLELELDALNNELTGLLIDISNNNNNIPLKETEIDQLDAYLLALDVEITNLQTDIALEEMNTVDTKLDIVKYTNGVAEVIGSSTTVDGWDVDVNYKLSVEVHNDMIVVWIDNFLVASCYDDSYAEGTFGFFGYGQKFELNNFLVEKKDYVIDNRSEFMSDELCHYLLEYDDLLESKKTEFEQALAKKETQDALLYVKMEELNQLMIQLKILLDERDVINTKIAKLEDQINQADNTFQGTDILTGDLNSLQNSLKVRLMEIEAKENDITIKENEILVVEDKVGQVTHIINLLQIILNVDNNFVKKLADERNQYVIEKEWSDNNIDDPKDLLKEGLEVFETMRLPKITLSLNIVNFLEMITEQINWDKLVLGDTFNIEHEKLSVHYKAKLTEADFNFEEGTINIKISNISPHSQKDDFLDMLYKSYSSSTTVSIDKWKWDLSMENKGSINELINNKWDANKQAIVGAKNQVVELSERGLIIRDPDNPLDYLVGINSLIAITNDGGKTWKHAITSTGIVGERIYGKVIMGVNLAIEDEHGILKFQGSKGEIFDRNGKLVMKLGLVKEPPESSGECFGLISFNDITRVSLTDCDGIVIEKNADKGWEKVLWASTDGTLYTHDIVAENLKIVNDIGKTILDAENNFFDIGDFQTIVMDNKLTTLEKMQIIRELDKIHSDYKLLLEQAEDYIRVHRDDVIDINGAFDVLNQQLPTVPSGIDKYSTQPLADAYRELIMYISSYVKVLEDGIGVLPLEIDINDPLTESTSEIPDRVEFIQKFKTYYDEAVKLRQKIEDTLFYASINMGEYNNNMILGEHGLIVLRSDGKYRAYLNATNGLALQKWEKGKWVNKVYASIGNSEYEDGTLIAEDLVAKRLRIETKDGKVLLDADALNFDFTVLNSIIYDDIIMSPEKSTLKNQYASLTGQKNKLKEQISRYVNTIYNDRDNSYYGLDDARQRLLTSEIDLDVAYNNLSDKLDIVFADMNTTTVISTDLSMTKQAFQELFVIFYQRYEVVRSRLEDFLERSSLQLGRSYNNTLIDANDGITVTRNNMMTRTRLNATEGIAIARNVGTYGSPSWENVFYVDTNGYLYANDMETQRLVVKGSAGEVFIDARIGLIDFSQFKTIVGQLRAENIYSNIVTAQDGFIADLVVNRVKTIDSAYSSGEMEYVHIQENFIKFISATSSGGSQQAYDFNGNPLYWLDGSQEQRTLENTGIPVVVENFDEVEKMKLHFTDIDGEKIPVIEMSVGGSGTSNMGYIYKNEENMIIEYYNQSSALRRIRLRNEGTIIDNADGNVVIMGGGFLVTGDKMESGWNDQTYKSQGGVYIPSNGNGVYNSFEASGVKGARWKYDDNNYILQTADAVNWYMGGKERIQLTPNSVKIIADDSNYIIINSSGITMKGNAINLN